MDDVISRRAAIDAECEVCQIAPKKERGHNCTYYVHGCKEIECLRELPSAQPEPCEDAVSREAVSSWLKQYGQDVLHGKYKFSLMYIWKNLMDLPSAQPEPQWIPFKTRPLTEEEKEEHSEWDGILDCKLPDDGQRILVSISVRGHECVQYDEFYMDDGCYLDSGYEIGTEAIAWLPLPEPYTRVKDRRQK